MTKPATEQPTTGRFLSGVNLNSLDPDSFPDPPSYSRTAAEPRRSARIRNKSNDDVSGRSTIEQHEVTAGVRRSSSCRRRQSSPDVFSTLPFKSNVEKGKSKKKNYNNVPTLPFKDVTNGNVTAAPDTSSSAASSAYTSSRRRRQSMSVETSSSATKRNAQKSVIGGDCHDASVATRASSRTRRSSLSLPRNASTPVAEKRPGRTHESSESSTSRKRTKHRRSSLSTLPSPPTSTGSSNHRAIENVSETTTDRFESLKKAKKRRNSLLVIPSPDEHRSNFKITEEVADVEELRTRREKAKRRRRSVCLASDDEDGSDGETMDISKLMKHYRKKNTSQSCTNKIPRPPAKPSELHPEDETLDLGKMFKKSSALDERKMPAKTTTVPKLSRRMLLPPSYKEKNSDYHKKPGNNRSTVKTTSSSIASVGKASSTVPSTTKSLDSSSLTKDAKSEFSLLLLLQNIRKYCSLSSTQRKKSCESADWIECNTGYLLPQRKPSITSSYGDQGCVSESHTKSSSGDFTSLNQEKKLELLNKVAPVIEIMTTTKDQETRSMEEATGCKVMPKRLGKYEYADIKTGQPVSPEDYERIYLSAVKKKKEVSVKKWRDKCIVEDNITVDDGPNPETIKLLFKDMSCARSSSSSSQVKKDKQRSSFGKDTQIDHIRHKDSSPPAGTKNTNEDETNGEQSMDLVDTENVSMHLTGDGNDQDYPSSTSTSLLSSNKVRKIENVVRKLGFNYPDAEEEDSSNPLLKKAREKLHRNLAAALALYVKEVKEIKGNKKRKK